MNIENKRSFKNSSFLNLVKRIRKLESLAS